MAAPVVRDHAEAVLREEQHLPVPHVGVQRPAVRERDDGPLAPVLVVDLGAVVGDDDPRRLLLAVTVVMDPLLSRGGRLAAQDQNPTLTSRTVASSRSSASHSGLRPASTAQAWWRKKRAIPLEEKPAGFPGDDGYRLDDRRKRRRHIATEWVRTRARTRQPTPEGMDLAPASFLHLRNQTRSTSPTGHRNGESRWERSCSATTSRSTESSRTGR